MPLRESEAIVLRSFPLGESDRLVSFFSRTGGRVRGVARGARRPKSRFGSTLEPLSHIRIWYYQRETRELVRIRQAELVESFLGAQRDFAATVTLSLMAEVAEAVLPEHEASEPAFRLLLHVARAVRDTGQTELPRTYFALWTVRLGGWLPELDRCARCGASLAEGAWGLPSSPGLACRRCRHAGMRALRPAALAAARRMQAEKLDTLLASDGLVAATRDLEAYLLDLVEHQIERKLNSRAMLETEN